MSLIPDALRVRRAAIHAVSICVATVALGTVGAAAATADPLPPQIHTVGGGGTCSGAVTWLGPCDGVAATSVPIQGARSVSALPGGGFLYIDSGTDLVREVSATGIVTTVAGTSTLLDNQPVPDTTDVDGVPATESGLDDPVAVAALPEGGFLITEYAGARVRMVSPGAPGQATITTVAGIPPTVADPGPTSGDNGSSGVGTSIELQDPSDAVPTSAGGVLIADTFNNRILLLSSYSIPGATIQQIAGGGGCVDATDTCDGVQASQVGLDLPDSVSEVPGGSGAYLVAECGVQCGGGTEANAVREISQESTAGIFSTVAGEPGSGGYSGDGGAATSAQLNGPEAVDALSGGGFLVADTGNDVVREVSASGVISTIAGTGTLGYTGDGGAATAAELNGPVALAPTLDGEGGILIADENNSVIREITVPSVSTITLSPAAPNGANGWYKTDPTVAVAATLGATINCVLDPAQAPPVFAAIAAGCAYTGGGAKVTTNGVNTFYAASENIFGDQENPVTVTFNVDTTKPTVKCGSEPVFWYGERDARVTAVLKDLVSGPRFLPLERKAKTRRLGAQKLRLRGADLAGVAVTVNCPYFVRPLKLAAQPAAHFKLRPVRGKKPAAVVSRMLVTDIPEQASVAVECNGLACPFAGWRRVSASPSHARRGKRTATVNLRRLFAGVKLPYGTSILVAVTAPETVGHYLRFTVGSSKRSTVSSGCLPLGARKPNGGPCSPKLP